MKQFPPYYIIHIYLDETLTIPVMDHGKGNYLVFWWRDIALGHLFIEPNEKLSDKGYVTALIKAISPAIEFYKEQNDLTNWQNFLLDKRLEDWSNWMHGLMRKWMPEEIPAKVPVSIIICTRDRAPYLDKCLAMLGRLKCVPDEIIVVDNNPKDNSTELVAANFPFVKYVREPRGGLSIARNTGLLHATQEIIAFTDDDAVTDPLWLYRLWETFEDPSVSAMTGLVLSLQLETEAQQIFEKHWSFNRGFIDKRFDSDYFDRTIKNGTPVWEIGAGVNMAFRSSVFREIGNFDIRLGAGASGCSEDSELWYRMLLKGMVIQYNPRAIMHHEHRKDIGGLKKQIFAYMKGHTAAALLQHDMYPQSGYKDRIFKRFPKNYFHTILRGFPKYPFQLQTVWVEIKGVAAGINFYNKNKGPKDKS